VVRRLSLWLPVALYAAVIFGLSSIPSLPAPPGPLTDKDIHTTLYAAFTALIVRALCGARLSKITLGPAVAAVGLAVLYGASDEFHQSFVPGRTMSGADLVADTIGALIAAGSLWAWAIIRRQARETHV
jgi:VanZ family protein